MPNKLFRASFASIPNSLRSQSKIFQYLSNIKIEHSKNGDYVFNTERQPLKFADFIKLETPNKSVAQIIYLEWIKCAKNMQKLNFDNDVKGILAEASDLKNRTISRQDLIDQLTKYLDTDTLIYWESSGSELRMKQEEDWGTALQKFANKMGIPALEVTDGLFEIQQDNNLAPKFKTFLNELNDFELASLSHLIKATKSAILAWGFAKNVFHAAEVIKLSSLEIDHQATKWGSRREYHEYSKILLSKKVILTMDPCPRARRAMSQEHPNSTPRRSFPKPILSAFGSTGSLQRKNRIFADKNNLINSYTPETPLKTERSKFIVPSNLSPFALSPKLMMARSWSKGRPTDLNNEYIMNSSLNSESFENTFLNSPTQFSTSTLNDSIDFPMDEEVTDHSFSVFVDKKSNFCSDYEIDSSSISPSVVSDFATEINFATMNEPWKSSKVNFLNDWTSSETAFACYAYENIPDFCENSDYFADNFEILELIGHGCFSVVYKVRSKRDDQIFALKKTKSSFKGNSDRSSRLVEVENLWKVRGCPNSIRVEFAWEQFGHLYIITEFCGRGSLKSLIEHLTTVEERFTETGIWDILLQCASALDYLHKRDIIHLDLKPENIFLTDDNILKIGDFGLSTTAGTSPSLHSEGDKYYMAPEVLEGLIILELAADIELPSNGDSWQNLRHGDFSELSLDDTSDMLNQLIKEMTHPAPESRPSVEKVLWRAQFYFAKIDYNNSNRQ